VGTSTNDPNIPTYNGATSGTNTSSKKSGTNNYDWNNKTVNGQSAAYQIQGYTVSVLINDAAFGTNQTLSQAKKDEITNFVSTAIGKPNDGSYKTKITVTSGVFKSPTNPFSQNTAFYKQPWFMGALAAAVVLLGGGVFFASRRRKSVVDVDMPAPPRREEAPLIVEESENQKMKKQLEKLASQKPEDFVNLLRTWLVEE
jgi:flagellar M-ring protein FliF